MRSILEYLDDCPFKYNKEENVNEVVLEGGITFLFFMSLLSGAIYFTVVLVSILIGILAYKGLMSTNRQELPDLSKAISKIVKEDIKCYLVKDRSPNAFNVGGTDCYMTNKLYDMLTEKERIAIFLHEYGHYHKGHLIKIQGVKLTVGTLIVVTLTFTMSFLAGLYLPIFGLLSSFLGNLVANIYSRIQEHEADSIAAQYGYKKELISALGKLEVYVKKRVCKGVKKEKCDTVMERVHSYGTHPSFKKRYEKILALPMVQKFVLKLALSNDSEESYWEKSKSFVTNIFNKEVKT